VTLSVQVPVSCGGIGATWALPATAPVRLSWPLAAGRTWSAVHV
jgi:hypothetical protein